MNTLLFFYFPTQRLESDVDSLLQSGDKGVSGPALGYVINDPLLHGDGESKRVEAYTAARDVEKILASATDRLRGIVARANATFERGREDPLEQVRGILDDQMGAMAAVDREASALLDEARAIAARLGDLTSQY